jgi:hypothetical protein
MFVLFILFILLLILSLSLLLLLYDYYYYLFVNLIYFDVVEKDDYCYCNCDDLCGGLYMGDLLLLLLLG